MAAVFCIPLMLIAAFIGGLIADFIDLFIWWKEKTMDNEAKKQIHDIMNYLLTHNKNLTKTQYYKLLDLADLLNPIVHGKEQTTWQRKYNKSKKEILPMSENKTSEAKLRAIKKYKQKVNRFTVDFHPTEEDLWNHLQGQPKKQTYIKDLIRADMKGRA